MILSTAPRKGRSRATAIRLGAIALLATLAVAGSAQAVPPPKVLLGTAGQFAVLAGSGITNTGASTISGDTGSSATSTETGFAGCPAMDCVTQIGANHTDPDPNDGVTSGAKAALATAYGDAAGRSPTSVPTELGGQNLVAGVYSAVSGTFGMSGPLTLDGAGNADSVFIFQTASTLITGGSGNVILIRGAQACNIFWKVGSAATLGAGSTLRGTVLAHDDISLGDGVTVHGRLLAGAQPSGAGAVTLIHDTITRPSTCVQQADVDAALAQDAADQAAAAAAAAQAAADKAAADQAAAAKAAAASQAAADKAAADQATASQAAADKAAADKVAADKVAADKAAVAKAAATKAAAKKKAAAAKRGKTTSTFGHARPPIRRVGLTG
jgi:pyruvate/2-oxoglutarate dehydrogenase complex dihydrolipoamide acyltransferase (E2) component